MDEADRVWKLVKEAYLAQLGRKPYDHWGIEQSYVRVAQGDKLHVTMRDKYAAQWMTRLQLVARRALVAIDSEYTRVYFYAEKETRYVAR